ncbi:hypothetical protein [Nocardia fluminea]|uniref:Uncharacterized protein n=1 Tax=Nocardia fluminea TaxID=134984 RepID=A0A2N3VAZ5_9NOCA|nr:hypothetical protein [Nocardia fluminea]PKV78804.1 hypothetical protein ATK86_3186 [Nocardia fluminea]
MTVVHLRRAEPGLLVIAPERAPLVIDAAPGLDVLVLDVVGGHLSWSLFDDESVPAAVLDDVEAAQDWVWAVYGEEVAAAVADNRSGPLTAVPARRAPAAALRRLAYAHWASRWWPASTLDGIPALDPRLLVEEIEALSEQCEMMVDGEIDELSRELDADTSLGISDGGGAAPGMGGSSSDMFDPSDGRDVEGDSAPIGRTPGRAEDYALAAGGADTSDGLIVARGSGGWNWRRCPPGILDAGENAVSWQVTRAAGESTVRVSVVASPDCRGVVPEHLRPYAWVRPADAPPARTLSPDAEFSTPLRRQGDAWTGSVRLPGAPESSPQITIFVPGAGPADPPEDESTTRNRIRRFARARLTESTGDQRLTAETAAAETDEDF